jgi:MFS family permease
MSYRTASWLAWPLAALGVTLYVLSIPMFLLARSANVPSGWGVDLTLGNLLAGASFLIFPLVGAMIASRRPRNPIGWLCLAIGLLWAFSGLLDYYNVYGMARPGSLPFPLAMAWVNNWLWVPSVGLLGTYVFLLFPDGRLPSRRWRPLAWLCGTVIGLVSFGFAFGPGPLEDLGGVQNPIVLLRSWMIPVFWVSLPLLPLCMLASALSLLLRYRHSGGEERQQIKWLAFAALIVGVTYLSVLVVGIFFVPTLVSGGDKTPVWYSLLLIFMMMSFAGVPIAIGFAVLKYRLYDIDVVINRALVYGPLTATLVALYFGGIVVLQRLFVFLTGQQSTLAVVASTLLIAAMFSPLRRRIQSFIDRRFYRSKYDAAKTLKGFSTKLRDETDLDALRGDLEGVVRETMQPAHVSLWLRPDTAEKRRQPN